MVSASPWPTEIAADRGARTLTVGFEDGQRFTFSAEFLRVHSPSAEVQGHSPEERKTVGGKKSVGLVAVEPVGNYAIKIVFDDLHDSGIYTWQTLYEFGQSQDAMWAAYLDELAAKGMSR